jgi:hypothetical protein
MTDAREIALALGGRRAQRCSDAFSNAVIAALLDRYPPAFDATEDVA